VQVHRGVKNTVLENLDYIGVPLTDCGAELPACADQLGEIGFEDFYCCLDFGVHGCPPLDVLYVISDTSVFYAISQRVSRECIKLFLHVIL